MKEIAYILVFFVFCFFRNSNSNSSSGNGSSNNGSNSVYDLSIVKIEMFTLVLVPPKAKHINVTTDTLSIAVYRETTDDVHQ